MKEIEEAIDKGRAASVRFALPLQTEHDLKAFVLAAWGVRIPDTKVCADHSTPWAAFRDAYFARNEVDVWQASRGAGGKSFLLALLALTEAVTLKIDVNLLGGSGEQAKRVLAAMETQWAHHSAPRQLLKSEPAQRETKLVHGNTIKALMASQKSVRGPHPTRLRVDEIDELDLALFDAAMGQPMSAKGVKAHVVASSTHQYQDGTMTEVKKRARENGWGLHIWCYRETIKPNGWLTPSEINSIRARMTVDMWNREMENQEPANDAPAIDTSCIEKVFLRALGEVSGELDEEYIFEEPLTSTSAQYAHGADWAKDIDFTDIGTLLRNAKPKPRLVSYLRTGRKKWPIMVGAFEDRLMRYPGKACHDGTGIGGPIGDYLTREAEPIVLTSGTRRKIVTEYIAAIENLEFQAPYIENVVREHKRMTAAVFGGNEHLPDSVAMGALMWHAHLTGGPLSMRML